MNRPEIPDFKGSGRTSETAARGSRHVQTSTIPGDLELHPWLGVQRDDWMMIGAAAVICISCVGLMVLGTL